MYNLLIGGAAGQGIETTAAILQKLFKKLGYYVFSTRDFMSRVRGGHNFTLLRIGVEPVWSHSDKLDGIIAFNEETIGLHLAQLKEEGFILCDTGWKRPDPRTIAVDMVAAAKELGNPRVAGSVAVGAILRLFSASLEDADSVLREYIKEQYLEVNRKAAALGYGLTEPRYPAPPGTDRGLLLLSGTQALCLGAIAAGVKFYSAYPMSPSTAIMEYLASKSGETGIVVEQAEDEIAAINMAIGASFAGVPAMTGTSGGGFSLKVEALGLSGMAEIPLVVVDVQRPGPVTGLPTRTEQSDLKFVISASQGEFPRMVIALRNHTDAFYQTARAFYIAQKYQIPVILLSDQYLGDSSATAEPYDLSRVSEVKPLRESEVIERREEERVEGKEAEAGEYLRYRYTEDGISPRLIPGKTRNFVTADSDEHDEYGRIIEDSDTRIRMMDKRLRKLEGLRKELLEPKLVLPEGAIPGNTVPESDALECTLPEGKEPQQVDTLLVGWGSTDGPISEAVRILNENSTVRYGALIFGDIYPFPQKLLLSYAPLAKEVINVEQNATGQLADLICEQTGIRCDRSILKYDGRQISAEEIVSRIRERGKRDE